MNEIEKEFEESAKMIGIKPITDKMIYNETQKLIDSGEIGRKTDYATIQKTAAKNLVTRFLRDKLKIDDSTRNEIQIENLQSSKTENSGIIYIKCATTEDAAIITSYAHNLSKTNFDKIAPAIVHHIPAIMYKQYQHCEKMLWKLRLRNPQQMMTKIRMGSRDFILRYKRKDDDTPWNQVPPLRIPDDAPKAEFKQKKALKENFQTPARQKQQTQKPNDKQTIEPGSQMEIILQNNKKHMMSQSQSSTHEEIEHKKQKNNENTTETDEDSPQKARFSLDLPGPSQISQTQNVSNLIEIHST